ncbi:MAG: class I SAM-dependent methyltransferase [Candidatus Dormibacteria bacterium]
MQCHIGLDTRAWARVGARVTGLDFSPAAITAAGEIAERAGLSDRAEFVRADVYDATDALGHATFEVVYVSLGALCWLPSVDRWAEQVGALVARAAASTFMTAIRWRRRWPREVWASSKPALSNPNPTSTTPN